MRQATIYQVGVIPRVSFAQRLRRRLPAPVGSLTHCHFNTRNLTGHRFGFLSVLGDSGERDRRRSILWTCRCDCGQMALRTGSTLQSGKSISCGHTRVTAEAIERRGQTQRREGACLRLVYRAYSAAAATRGHVFELTQEQFQSLVCSTCVYCGRVPTMVKRTRFETLLMNGLDRVDNAQGYTPTNVVSCCTDCNWMKGNFDLSDFLRHVERIHLHQSETKGGRCA